MIDAGQSDAASSLEQYAAAVGAAEMEELRALAWPLEGPPWRW